MSPSLDPNRLFAEGIVRRLRDSGHQALFAGGCVRDLLLGRTPKDYDVATDARPERVRDLFGSRRTLAVGASFGVVVVLPTKADREAGAEQVEVATFRTEGPYLDGRRPENVSFASPEEDARRRDFTINGMFFDPIEDRVLDDVGGRSDLAAGVVRAIGDPRARMAEDKLRLLRAVRFAATLGFRLEPATAAAVREMAPQLTVVSAERIAQELRRMLVHENRRRAVELCVECGLLAIILPELAADTRAGTSGELPPRTLLALEFLERPSFEAAFVTLLLGSINGDSPETTAESICRRLRLSNAETDRVVWLIARRGALDGVRQARPSRLKRLCVEPGVSDLLTYARAAALADGNDVSEILFVEAYRSQTPPEEINPPQFLTGRDLIALGFKPGPGFKRTLDTVRDAQLDGEVTSHGEALDLARRLHGGNVTDTNGPP